MLSLKKYSYLQRRTRDTDIKNKCMDTKGGKEGSRMNWETGTDTYTVFTLRIGLPGDSDSKESVHNTGDPRWIPGSGRSPGEGNGNPLQYSCPENPMHRGA